MHAFIVTIISFIFVLGVLVFIHELGHYLAARWRGVHVDVFSIGFGKPLYKWRDKVGTEWRLCPIPLGGYVKPHGFEDPEDATDEQKANWIPGKTFHAKPVLDRSIVIFAGPFFNFVLAVILFAGVFAISGKPFIKPVVENIVPNSAASQAGMKPHDIIIQIDKYKNPDAQSLALFAKKHPGMTTTVIVKREGKEVSLPITISSKLIDHKSVGQLGIVMGRIFVEKHRLSIEDSVVYAFRETWNITADTVIGLGQMVTRQRSLNELGGPLKIAQISGQVAEKGFDQLILMMAVLSINLGLINLFPIPMLDGGRLLFYVIEAVCRKPVHKKIQAWAFQIGFGLILLLFLFSTYNDISQLGLISWFTSHSK